jgi:hypothetical protein
MVRSGKSGADRTPGTASPSRNRAICQRYATGLYRQAFLTLGDPAGPGLPRASHEPGAAISAGATPAAE